VHTDHQKDKLKDTAIIKVLWILNSDWKKTYGGGFEHGGVLHSPEPGDFIIFDPRVPHRAQDILTDKKRIAIDWTLKTWQNILSSVILVVNYE
jgi:hypothetical protein